MHAIEASATNSSKAPTPVATPAAIAGRALRTPRSSRLWSMRRATRSPAHHTPMLAATTATSSTAAAEAGKTQRVSGSANQRTASTASVGGLFGPRISATSTTDKENASTAYTGSRICA